MSLTGKAPRKSGTGSVVVSMASIIVVAAGLKLAAPILVPIALGIFLGILSLPVLNFLDHKLRLPRPLAIFFTVALTLIILGGAGYVISGVIPEFQERGPEYAARLKSQAGEYSESIDRQLRKFDKLGSFFGVEPNNETGQHIPTFQEMFNRYWNTERVVELIGQTAVFERFTALASKFFFVLILMIFVLAESKRWSNKVAHVIKARGPDLRRLQNSSKDIQNYLVLKTGVSLLTGILAWLTCILVGIEFALLWGVLAFVLNFIPVVGSILAAFPPVVLALIMQGIWPAVIVLTAYLIINQGIGNFLEPRLLGQSFGISTVVVILSVVLWGYIWGAAGMFLAVPLTMMVKVMLENDPNYHWLSVLLSSDDAIEKIREEE